MRHVIVMTSTGATGLVALFLVDFADMYFLSLLGEIEIAAAIGYAGTVMFFTVAIGIGLAIATTALVSKAVGANQTTQAKRYATNAIMFSLFISISIAVIIWFILPDIISYLGATTRTHQLAVSYLSIVVPALPLLTVGMCCAAILRSVGDAKQAMYVTLIGGIVNAIFDPILIFTAGLGVDGAALASVFARIAVATVGLYGVVRVHKFLSKPTFGNFFGDIPAILKIAIPALLTNIATPIGNAYVTVSMALYGDSAVAGWAIIGRIIPVAFGVIFALSGAIGPILGQNLGAQLFPRVRSTLTNAIIFIIFYILAIWAILALLHPYISLLFGVGDVAAHLITVFCVWLTPLFAFMGALFVANAAFNNLGRPHYSTVFNWGRATLGTMPFVYFGSLWFGAIGVIAGNMIGGILFGTIAVLTAYRVVDRLEKKAIPVEEQMPPLQRRFPSWPFSSPRA